MMCGAFLLVGISAVAALDQNSRFSRPVAYIEDDAGEIYDEEIGYITPEEEIEPEKVQLDETMEPVVEKHAHAFVQLDETMEPVVEKHAFVELDAGKTEEAEDFVDDSAKITKVDMAENDDDEPVHWAEFPEAESAHVKASEERPQAKIDVLEEAPAFIDAGEAAAAAPDAEPYFGMREHPDPVEAKAEAVPDAKPSFGMREHDDDQEGLLHTIASSLGLRQAKGAAVEGAEEKPEAPEAFVETSEPVQGDGAKPYFGMREHDDDQEGLLHTIASSLGLRQAKGAAVEGAEEKPEAPEAFVETSEPVQGDGSEPYVGMREHSDPVEAKAEAVPDAKPSFGMREHDDDQEGLLHTIASSLGLRQRPGPALVEVAAGAEEHPSTGSKPEAPEAFVETSEPIKPTMGETDEEYEMVPASSDDIPFASFEVSGDGVGPVGDGLREELG